MQFFKKQQKTQKKECKNSKKLQEKLAKAAKALEDIQLELRAMRDEENERQQLQVNQAGS